MTENILRKETATYEKQKQSLIGKAEGEWALIKGEEVCGTYKNQFDAIGEGYKQFGNVPFMVKEIVKVEEPANFVSNLLTS